MPIYGRETIISLFLSEIEPNMFSQNAPNESKNISAEEIRAPPRNSCGKIRQSKDWIYWSTWLVRYCFPFGVSSEIVFDLFHVKPSWWLLEMFSGDILRPFVCALTMCYGCGWAEEFVNCLQLRVLLKLGFVKSGGVLWPIKWVTHRRSPRKLIFLW